MFEWFAIDLTTDGHDPAHRLQRKVAGAVMRIRTGLTKICNRGHDQSRIPFKQLINAIAPALKPAWLKAFDHNVAVLYEFAQNGSARGQAQVERYAALVPIQILKQQTLLARRGIGFQWRKIARKVTPARLLDFDYVCTVVTE